MEENKDNKTPGNVLEENPQNDTTPVINPAYDNPKQSPKKSKKKLIIILIILLTLIAGSAGAYFLLNKNKQDSAAPAASAPSEESVDQQTKLFLQFDQKIIAYDTATKQSSVITEEVPKDSTVIDFYYNSDNEWRYYSFNNYDEVYFSDQASDPKLVGGKKYKYSAVANAEKKTFAYTETGHLENSTTKTYLSANNEDPELVYESRKSDYDPDTKISSDTKSFLYVVRDISTSGEELLYQQEPCFECGGIGLKTSSNLFKLNLKTKKTEVMNKSEEGAEHAYFNGDDDIIFIEDKTSGYDTGNLKINITAYLIKKDGTRTKLFQTQNTRVLAYSLSRKGDFAVTQFKGDNYNNEEANTLPGELYTLSSGKQEALEADLGKYDYHLGYSIDDCIAAGFDSRQLQGDDFVYEYSVGVICKNDNGIYTYDALEDITNSGDSAEEIIYTLL